MSIPRRYLIAMAGTVCLFLSAATTDPVSYPDGYRKWVHVRTGLIGPESPAFETYGGMHHIYANAKAMEGFASGKFPEGAVFVFDLHDVMESKGSTTEGPRKKIEVMVKDSGRYASTGGWGFERFLGDELAPVLTDADRAKCFACHQGQRNNDSVFSTAPK
jgi:hypothetical protein